MKEGWIMKKVALLLGLLFLMFTHLSLAKEVSDKDFDEYFKSCKILEKAEQKNFPEYAKNFVLDETYYKATWGFYITAYKSCRAANGTVEECINKVEKVRQLLRETCPKREIVVLVHNSFFTLVKELEDRFFGDELSQCCLVRGAPPKECRERNAAFIISYCRTYIGNNFPGSSYSPFTGSGIIKYPVAEVTYQAGRVVAIRYINPNEGVEYLIGPKTLKLQLGSYYLTFAIDSEQNSWELIEVNLPVEAQIERLALAEGKGVKINYKELIPLLNSFFKESYHGVSFPTYIWLLSKEKERQEVLKAFLEYLAWDNFKRAELASKKKTNKPPQVKEKKK
jgi:hypothetical protein